MGRHMGRWHMARHMGRWHMGRWHMGWAEESRGRRRKDGRNGIEGIVADGTDKAAIVPSMIADPSTRRGGRDEDRTGRTLAGAKGVLEISLTVHLPVLGVEIAVEDDVADGADKTIGVPLSPHGAGALADNPEATPCTERSRVVCCRLSQRRRETQQGGRGSSQPAIVRGGGEGDGKLDDGHGGVDRVGRDGNAHTGILCVEQRGPVAPVGNTVVDEELGEKPEGRVAAIRDVLGRGHAPTPIPLDPLRRARSVRAIVGRLSASPQIPRVVACCCRQARCMDKRRKGKSPRLDPFPKRAQTLHRLPERTLSLCRQNRSLSRQPQHQRVSVVMLLQRLQSIRISSRITSQRPQLFQNRSLHLPSLELDHDTKIQRQKLCQVEYKNYYDYDKFFKTFGGFFQTVQDIFLTAPPPLLTPTPALWFGGTQGR